MSGECEEDDIHEMLLRASTEQCLYSGRHAEIQLRKVSKFCTNAPHTTTFSMILKRLSRVLRHSHSCRIRACVLA